MITRSLVITAAFVATSITSSSALTLSSPDLHNGDTAPTSMVLNGFGCSGGNTPPPLRWTAPPNGTKELALTLYDPDAPTTVGWVHWTVYKIPMTARSLSPIPMGSVLGLTDFGKPGYGGPCPPPGDKPHRYIFELDALDTELPLDATTTYAAYHFMSRGHVLTSGRLTLRYGR